MSKLLGFSDSDASLTINLIHATSQRGKKQATESLKQREVVLLHSFFPTYKFSFDFI